MLMDGSNFVKIKGEPQKMRRQPPFACEFGLWFL